MNEIKRCYIDAGVLIDAARGRPGAYERAFAILDDPRRRFVSCPMLKLELIPQATYNKRWDEIKLYEKFFEKVIFWKDMSDDLIEDAIKIAGQHGLDAIDAIHIAAALSSGADEFITTEKPSKPLHKVKNISIITLYYD